jgi:DNA-binding transcriptional ArsR family regulator
MEVVWLSYVHEDETAYPARHRILTSSAGLAEAMADLWGDEPCFTEMAVLANQGGVLFEHDPDTLWKGLEAAAASPPVYEELASEKAEEKLLIRSRIARLYEDREQRARWMDTVRQVWEAIADGWESEGRAYVEAVQCELRSKLGDRAGYADVEPYIDNHKDWRALMERLIAQAAEEDLEVTLVPTWLSRKNVILSFHDRVLLGPILTEPPISPTAATRSRARRLKALGDPTRLAIFEAVARRPRTVGDLARQLRLSQPTVSNHVRLLRDAGLIEQDKDQSRRLTADLSAFDGLLEEARRAVGHDH